MADFTKKVRADFSKMMKSFCLPSTHFYILLGLSGGADSSVLFSLLYENREKYGYSLAALHVNHMIRGHEADRDEEFCLKLCEKHGVEFTSLRADIPKMAKESGLGLEEAARNFRYSAFEDAARKIGERASCEVLIATAHNADDNTETVLFNLTRGTSLTGLSGIKPKRDNIIRPILLSTKDEILGYSHENGIEYITDSTNSENEYTRNRIRHLVVPELKKINPLLASAVSRMTASAALDCDYLETEAKKFLNVSLTPSGIPLDKLNILHPAVKSRAVRSFLVCFGVREPSETNISDVIRLCSRGVPHSGTDLPGGMSAKIEGGMLTVKKTRKAREKVDLKLFLDYGVTEIPQTGDLVARFKSSDRENFVKFKNIYKIFIQTEITSAKIEGAVFVRTRQSGDTVNIGGVNRKLKKLLWEIEPDPEMRDRLPIFCDGGGILWVPGSRSRSGSFPKQNEDSEIFIYVKNKDLSD